MACTSQTYVDELFLSTLPARGATADGQPVGHHVLFLSTLPARGATQPSPQNLPLKVPFLSTLPARGATEPCALVFVRFHISIHAPREGSDQQDGQDLNAVAISIHAPREGSDGTRHLRTWTLDRNFYPRSPRGERRVLKRHRKEAQNISIHAPREGSDQTLADPQHHQHHFYPRSPRGERPTTAFVLQWNSRFLSTLPARGATARGIRLNTGVLISIHAPREGSDFQGQAHFWLVQNFYPRSPRGERPGGRGPAWSCR